ncbi:hypothetical protein G7054_g725 [Neopestalotiopsis clavispora]|nr:hypothetical protein G7054_g725 [Neopestalotiopsis clavispora]
MRTVVANTACDTNLLPILPPDFGLVNLRDTQLDRRLLHKPRVNRKMDSLPICYTVEEIDERDKSCDRRIARTAESCTLCQNIKMALTSPRSLLPGGFLNELMNMPCQDHVDLIIHLIKTRQKTPLHTRYGSKWTMPYLILSSLHDGPGAKLQLRDLRDSRAWYVEHDWLLVQSSAEAPIPGRGRLLDSDWVEIEILRNWKQECLTKHGTLCCNPFRVRHTHPAWLIDVVKNCLVPGDGISDFVALSYRWGKATCLQTELANLDELQQPGALLLPRFADLVSPVIQHTTKMIHVLGERYLWADALCIVQNDSEQTAQQLLLMGAIYASAKFTVVATDGDASYGIPGLKGISQPRNLQQTIIPLGRKDAIIQRNNPKMSNLPEASHYSSRAWTFQEFVLSKRRLIVGKNQFHWSCSSATFHEDVHGADSESHRQITRFQASDILCGMPEFGDLGPLFSEYSSRDLTFPEDALAGASGLISIMSRSFEGGFNYGIPDFCFESALTWYQNALSDSVQRRTHSGKDHSILPGSQLPSWSWLGWKTKNKSLYFFDENMGELCDPSDITTRTVQWYSHETPSSTKRPIRSKLSDHDGDITGNRLDDHIALAQGWTKEIFEFHKHYESEPSHYRHSDMVKLGDFVYKHQRLPGRRFWFPFPLMDVDDMSSMNERPQHAFLSCKTHRGWFQVQNAEAPPNRPRVEILGQDDSGSGHLYVDTQKFAEELRPDGSNQSFTVELVAVCKRKKPVVSYGSNGLMELRIGKVVGVFGSQLGKATT